MGQIWAGPHPDAVLAHHLRGYPSVQGRLWHVFTSPLCRGCTPSSRPRLPSLQQRLTRRTCWTPVLAQHSLAAGVHTAETSTPT